MHAIARGFPFHHPSSPDFLILPPRLCPASQFYGHETTATASPILSPRPGPTGPAPARPPVPARHYPAGPGWVRPDRPG